MLKAPFTVVKYIAPDKPNWDLTHGKEYAVETNTDFVDQDDTFLTVWSDDGTLAEVYEGEYEVVAVDEQHWFRVRPDRIFVEEL